jgi:hypothetical protein
MTYRRGDFVVLVTADGREVEAIGRVFHGEQATQPCGHITRVCE